ncbi:MAG: pyrroline-5-carboxylate reductase [Chloroflexi bacterium RBG_16_50_11]|nr:MAG: pyrroline-5-carboxylate reductase [Chloroflexi bacterium RBG_16_50_11]
MKIAFIGGGNMGEAIIRALLEKQLCQPADISVSDISDDRRQYLQKQYGVTVTASNREAVSGSEVVVLAVKPQNINEVTNNLKGILKADQLVLSIAAGVRLSAISERTGHRKIVRAMPNTPAQIGLGISGWMATKEVTAKQKSLVKKILGAMGKEIYFEDEGSLDMVTAISGSGPAYFYLFAEALIDGAVELGLNRADAEALVKQTMLGAAHLVDKSGETPAELRRNVTSKGGTTERAIAVFEENDFAGIVGKAVKAAYQRAKELGGAKS